MEVMKIMMTSVKRSHACTSALSTPTLQQATIDPRLHQRLPDAQRQDSCRVTVSFSRVLVHKVLCPPRVYFPVLFKFGQLCGGVNGDPLQEDLCHTHPQSPYPCGIPMPTRLIPTSNTVLSQSLWGPWVLVCTRFV